MWEYLWVEYNGYQSRAGVWRDSLGRTGSELPDLNELGAQGWELAGVASGDPQSYRLFFKRPRS